MKATVKTVLDEICNVSDFSYFVTMTDKFLTGWGEAEGKTAKRVYLCKSKEIAESLVKRLEERKSTSGMKNVNICSSLPNYSSAKYVVSYDNAPETAFNF